jgi:hypothetical protein
MSLRPAWTSPSPGGAGQRLWPERPFWPPPPPRPPRPQPGPSSCGAGRMTGRARQPRRVPARRPDKTVSRAPAATARKKASAGSPRRPSRRRPILCWAFGDGLLHRRRPSGSSRTPTTRGAADSTSSATCSARSPTSRSPPGMSCCPNGSNPVAVPSTPTTIWPPARSVFPVISCLQTTQRTVTDPGLCRIARRHMMPDQREVSGRELFGTMEPPGDRRLTLRRGGVQQAGEQGPGPQQRHGRPGGGLDEIV